MVNEVVGVSNIPIDAYEAKLREMDMRWLRDTLIDEEYRVKVFWPTIEGITSAYFYMEAWRWLALVGRDSSIWKSYRCDLFPGSGQRAS